jgi:predicted regulator of Ras-like GTPase activity (Roadblock/LC7/MglB family)
MSSVQPPPESASRAGRLDRILRDLLHQTPGVEAAAVVSFDGLPMASALPSGMDEDRVAAMSAALLSLAERAAQGLGRGDLSQVYIEGEHGTVFLVSAQDEGVLVAVTSAGAKVGMMLYEVKLAANRVGEVLHGPAPLPAPLPTHVTRGYLDAQDRAVTPAYAEPVYAEPAQAAYVEPAYVEPVYAEPVYAEPAYAEPAYYAEAPAPAYAEPAYVEPAAAPLPAEPAPWSSYAPTGSVLPGEQGSWS